jgi:4-amino-4-deoxy-L-arabinose transferase-like glycosyltransferase
VKTISTLRTKNRSELLKLLSVSLAIGAALLHFARFFFIALSRLAFPFSLEWMEGGSLVQVSRILAGQPLYIKPSFDFIPQIYPPVYFYLSAIVSLFLGNGFLPLRLVSILATVGTLVLIFILVYEQSGSKVAGFLASGLYSASYALTGHWFDIARVDSLALAFLLLAAYLVLQDRPIASILGGLFLALSCFTKQTMLMMAVVYTIYSLFSLRRTGLYFSGAALIGLLVGTLLLDWLHEGWYSYYIFQLPGRHNVLPGVATLLASTHKILFVEILQPIFFATAIGLIFLVVFPMKRYLHEQTHYNLNPNRLRSALWIFLFVTGLWAIASLCYLAGLPSDPGGGVVGPYSLARLLLMTGPAFTVTLVVILTIQMRNGLTWIDQIARWFFENIHYIPRMLVGGTFVVVALLITLAYFKSDLYNSLSITHLQRLSPYLIGLPLLFVLMGLLWRFLWPAGHTDTWFFLFLGLGLVAISWLGRLNPGGYYNVFMTAFAGIAILFGLGMGMFLERLFANTSRGKDFLNAFMLFLSAGQLLVLLSPSSPQIPTRADLEAGQELVGRIKACPGEVYVPFHTYLAELAGKNGYAGVVEMGELRGSFGGKADPLWEEVFNQIQLSLDSYTFAAVIQDNQIFRDAMSDHYIEAGQVFDEELVFWPVTGRKIRPEIIYTPINREICIQTVE